MFDLIADEPMKKKRREEYDVEDSIGLVNPTRRRGPDTGADYHQLSHLPWKAPIADAVERVFAPILWNGDVPKFLIGLALAEDLNKSTLPMKTHPIETQSSRTCEKAETRRFAGGDAFDFQPPTDEHGSVLPWTQHQSMNIKVLQGLPLYLGDATGGVIAIAD